MSLCKVCLNESFLGLSELLYDPPICINCLKKMKPLFLRERIDGVDYLFLYEYDEILKNMIFSFKGLFNISLSSAFTYKYKDYLKEKYHKYTFFCVPSTVNADVKRGFNHVEEIAKTISKSVIKPFYKKIEWKQSDKNREERKNIENVIGIKENMIKNIKRIVIIDDIFSTGNTIKACIRQIKHKCDIKVLCVCRKMSNNV